MDWIKYHFEILRDLEDGFLEFRELSEISKYYVMKLVIAGYSSGRFLDG